MDYSATYTRKAKIKKTANTKYCQGLEQLTISYTDTESRNWYNHFGNFCQYLLKLNIIISSVSLFGIYIQQKYLDMYNKTYTRKPTSHNGLKM